MPKMERGVVKSPNDQTKAPIGNGFLPLAHDGSPIARSPGTGGDRRGGSFSLADMASPIKRNQGPGGDRRGFSSDDEMPAATEPGKGAVPVNPFLPGGASARSALIADDAKARAGR